MEEENIEEGGPSDAQLLKKKKTIFDQSNDKITEMVKYMQFLNFCLENKVT